MEWEATHGVACVASESLTSSQRLLLNPSGKLQRALSYSRITVLKALNGLPLKLSHVSNDPSDTRNTFAQQQTYSDRGYMSASSLRSHLSQVLHAATALTVDKATIPATSTMIMIIMYATFRFCATNLYAQRRL
ncbi:hypothetical protein CPB83DRAFT_639679 [Crepidotus variabilis]|uniref:Uncharacterized protein n=1 Tax=Crepidotus variabilis TaxID=179855 RepID=A0A9P6JKS8_9AGAR|nr:hypothetical protein CPB83DRAFT_639679 [Crepidotus variabilis]